MKGAIPGTLILMLWSPLATIAADTAEALRDHAPKRGVFPPEGAGIQLSGDLVISDPMNRRGGIRQGDSAHRPAGTAAGKWQPGQSGRGRCPGQCIRRADRPVYG